MNNIQENKILNEITNETDIDNLTNRITKMLSLASKRRIPPGLLKSSTKKEDTKRKSTKKELTKKELTKKEPTKKVSLTKSDEDELADIIEKFDLNNKSRQEISTILKNRLSKSGILQENIIKEGTKRKVRETGMKRTKEMLSSPKDSPKDSPEYIKPKSKKAKEEDKVIKLLNEGITFKPNLLQVYLPDKCTTDEMKKILDKKAKDLFNSLKTKKIEEINSVYFCLYRIIENKNTSRQVVKDSLEKLLYVKYKILQNNVNDIMVNIISDKMENKDTTYNVESIKNLVLYYIDRVDRLFKNPNISKDEILTKIILKYKEKIIDFIDPEMQQYLIVSNIDTPTGSPIEGNSTKQEVPRRRRRLPSGVSK